MDRFLTASTEIRQAPDQTEKAYLARQLVQVSLPHSDPGNVPVWRRVNGNLTLSIQTLISDDDTARFPYGVLPRLVLYWICSEAVKTQSRRLSFGRSFSSFMRSLDLNASNGGKRSDSVRLHDQLDRLLGARIQLRQAHIEGLTAGVTNQFMQISDSNELWWTPGKSKQDSLFESWVELGEVFYKTITAAPVPLDLRAIKALRNSPLGLDLYSLICLKTYTANRHGTPQMIPWDGLHLQMGGEYSELRQFRARVRALLPRIAAVYPAMKVTAEAGHLVIAPAPTAIASRPTKRIVSKQRT